MTWTHRKTMSELKLSKFCSKHYISAISSLYERGILLFHAFIFGIALSVTKYELYE